MPNPTTLTIKSQQMRMTSYCCLTISIMNQQTEENGGRQTLSTWVGGTDALYVNWYSLKYKLESSIHVLSSNPLFLCLNVVELIRANQSPVKASLTVWTSATSNNHSTSDSTAVFSRTHSASASSVLFADFSMSNPSWTHAPESTSLCLPLVCVCVWKREE